jgi:tyrosine-protein kinase Etk/Wzc
MTFGASLKVIKSFISSNLAAVIAQAGQKVLVIDGDMLKGYLQKIFDKSSDNGLSDHLRGDITFNDAIKKPVLKI